MFQHFPVSMGVHFKILLGIVKTLQWTWVPCIALKGPVSSCELRQFDTERFRADSEVGVSTSDPGPCRLKDLLISLWGEVGSKSKQKVNLSSLQVPMALCLRSLWGNTRWLTSVLSGRALRFPHRLRRQAHTDLCFQSLHSLCRLHKALWSELHSDPLNLIAGWSVVWCPLRFGHPPHILSGHPGLLAT